MEKFIYLQAFEKSFINSASRIDVTIVFLQINLNNFCDCLIDFGETPETICGNFGNSAIDFP